MGNPKVTAIITTHNRRDLVSRAIESVLAQTYDNLDCIVVDDASDISTEDICASYPVWFIYIPKKESTGGNHARNVGILASDAKYVAFLDDDDYWLPSKIEKQVKLIEEKKCELVYSGACPEYPDGRVLYEKYKPYYNNQGDMSRKILYGICCLNITILADRASLINVGLFDENVRFWQEYELTMRLAQRKPFYFVPEVLAVFRVDVNDKGRLTNKYYEWKKSVNYIYKKHKDLYAQLNFIERLRVRMNFDGDAIARSASSGLVWLNRWYKFKMNSIYLPLRLYLKLKACNE